jgi:hypothetical protein
LSELTQTSPAAVLQKLIEIVRAKAGPEDLPVSAQVLVLTILATIVPDAILLVLVPNELPLHPAVLMGLGIIITLLWYGMLLQLAGHAARFLQTMTALFGVQLVMAPLLVFSGWFYVTYQKDPTWGAPAAVIRMAVEVWVLIIMARILRSATGWPTFACVGLAVAGEMLGFLLIAGFIPQADVVAPVVAQPV